MPTASTTTAASSVLDDGLPPPTHAQIEYWRKLCGELTQARRAWPDDGAWPTDLAPTRPTLTALVERGLIVRRTRRGTSSATGTAALLAASAGGAHASATLAERPRPDLPSYAEIEGFEDLPLAGCPAPTSWARLPFVGLGERVWGQSETPTPLLHLMRKHRVARHTQSASGRSPPPGKTDPRALAWGRARGPRDTAPQTRGRRALRRGLWHRHVVPQPRRSRWPPPRPTP